MQPDMDLLTAVTIGCGPSIYNADASTVAGSQESELETVKNNFLIKKLGLSDGPELMDAINSVIETYGRSERNKYRAVVYYLLTKHFGKEAVYSLRFQFLKTVLNKFRNSLCLEIAPCHVLSSCQARKAGPHFFYIAVNIVPLNSQSVTAHASSIRVGITKFANNRPLLGGDGLHG